MQALQIREFLASVTPALSLHFIKISLQIANCREQVPFFNYQQAAGRLPHLWVGNRDQE